MPLKRKTGWKYSWSERLRMGEKRLGKKFLPTSLRHTHVCMRGSQARTQKLYAMPMPKLVGARKNIRSRQNVSLKQHFRSDSLHVARGAGRIAPPPPLSLGRSWGKLPQAGGRQKPMVVRFAPGKVAARLSSRATGGRGPRESLPPVRRAPGGLATRIAGFPRRISCRGA